MDIPVLVLARAVVSMKMEISFTETMVLQEMVKKTNNAVAPLSNAHTLINEVIDLVFVRCDVIVVVSK